MAAPPLDPMLVAAVTFSVERCLARHGGTLPRAASSGLADLADWWAAAAVITGEDLALQVAQELPMGAFGLVSYGLVSAATLGDALANLGTLYLERLVPGMALRVLPFDRDHVDVRLQSDGDERLMPLLEEVVLAVVHQHLALLTAPATLRMVALRRPAPAATAAWRMFFGVLPRFAQRYSLLRLAAGDLATPLRTASPELQSIVTATATPAVPPTLGAQVRAYVRTHVRADIEPAAVALATGVTPRTLQRRLQEEGTSLRDLTTAVRMDLARDMLAHGEATVSEVAAAVGFPRLASFSRAFAAAVGEAPLEYRRRHQT